MTVVLICLIGPSTKLFEINNLWFNMQVARYLTIVVYIIFIFRYLFLMRISREQLYVFILTHSLIFSILITTFIRNGVINFTYILNIIAFVSIYLYSCFIFSNYFAIRENILKNIIKITLIFSSLLSIGVFGYEPFLYVHKVFYNYYLGLGYETLFDFAILNNRSYSIFTGPNQFSFFSSFSTLVFYYFYKNKQIKFRDFIIFFLLSLLILTISGSRTGLIFFVIIFLLLFKNILIHKKLLSINLFIVVFLSLFFLPERIFETIFNIDTLISTFFEQRIAFWINIFDLISNDFSLLFLGFSEKLFIEGEGSHFESGYLQLLGIGGIFSLILFLIILNYFYSLSKKIYPFKYLIIIFLLGEILMGLFFELKWSILNAIIISFITVNKGVK